MKGRGPWSSREIAEFLEDRRIPLRLACNGASGHPVLASLWFVPLRGKLWCATPRTSRVAQLLAEDPRCSFEVSVEQPPYVGVRGPALATLHPEEGGPVLRTLLERYQGGLETKLARLLLERVDDEVAIAIAPETIVSWDFRDRMGDAP